MELNSNNIERLFFDTVLNYSYLLPLVFLLLYIRKIRMSAFIGVVTFYFIAYFLLNVFYDEIKFELGKKLYYSLYTFLEFVTFAYIFWKFTKSKKFRLVILVSSIAFVTFLVIYIITLHKIKTVDTVTIGVETIIIFVYIFYYFYQYFKTSHISIITDYSFWLVTGILAYLGSTFFFNILADSIDPVEFKKYWYLTYLGDIIKNILSAVAVILFAKNPNNNNNKEQKPASVPYLDMI